MVATGRQGDLAASETGPQLWSDRRTCVGVHREKMAPSKAGGDQMVKQAYNANVQQCAEVASLEQPVDAELVGW